MGVGRIQFLEGGWTRASVPHCLLVALISLSCGSFSIGQLITWPLTSSDQSSEMRPRERKLHECKMEVSLDPISEVTSNHFCNILLSRSKSLGSGHARGKGMTQECEYQEVKITGVPSWQLTTIAHSLAPNDLHPFHLQNTFTQSPLHFGITSKSRISSKLGPDVNMAPCVYS